MSTPSSQPDLEYATIVERISNLPVRWPVSTWISQLSHLTSYLSFFFPSLLISIFFSPFLVKDTQLYKRLCPSVHPWTQVESGKTSVLEGICVYISVERGLGVDGGWLPLPTRPQRYRDLASLVSFCVLSIFPHFCLFFTIIYCLLFFILSSFLLSLFFSSCFLFSSSF